jgi:hypothetical protein
MSIDFNVRIEAPFKISEYLREIDSRLREFGLEPPPIEVTIEPFGLEPRDGPGDPEGLDSLPLGPSYPDRIIELKHSPNIWVLITIASYGEGSDRDCDIEATAFLRTPSSVVLAIAAATAAASLGDGDFRGDGVSSLLLRRPSDADDLVRELRISPSARRTFEEGAAEVLHTMPGRASWSSFMR